MTEPSCQGILDDVEDLLRDAFTRVLQPDLPMEALQAVRETRELLSEWDSHLARQALAAGATWESIGAALGISRQAAWERLRPGITRQIQADRIRIETEKAKLREERAQKWPTKKS